MAEDRPRGWGGAPVAAPGLEEIRAGASRVANTADSTSLHPLHTYNDVPDIHLKPETLQPIGSFKLRGVYNWASTLSESERNRGLFTTSAGNTAQALGYVARLFNTTARTVVPDWLPDNKLQSIINYGATPIKVPSDEMYPLLRQVVDEAALVSEADARAAIRRLALGNKLIAEGAGAISVAAALNEPPEKRGKTVCIVSGGGIDPELLASILTETD